MKGQLRIRLPPVSSLSPGTPLEWVWMQREAMLAQGEDTLPVLGARFPAALAVACVDVQDLILLDLLLPPLSGRRLEVALQGEIEVLLLEDLSEVAFAHGPQGRDGRVPVAWLGREALQQVVAAFAGTGLRLQALYPTPLLLPLRKGVPTLQECGDHLLVRASVDHGWVQWRVRGDNDVAYAQLGARLAGEGVPHTQWIAAVPEAWAATAETTTVLPLQQQCSGPLPGWSLPLPSAASRPARLAVALGLVAVLLAALGLQAQAWRWAGQGQALQQDMQRKLRAAFPEIGEVVDPLRQARRAVATAAATPPQPPEVQQLAASVMQAVPALAGAATRMEYRPGLLQLWLDPAAAPLDDPARLEHWQQALQGQGLQLTVQDDGVLAIRAAGTP